VTGTVAIPCYPTAASDIQSNFARHRGVEIIV
jgi:hypothetical protein